MSDSILSSLYLSASIFFLSMGLLLIYFVISISKSIEYGKKHRSFLKGILKIILSGIISYCLFCVLYMSFAYGTGFNAVGSKYNSPFSTYYFYTVVLGCFVFLYGTLSYHKKKINTWLILGGYIGFIIPWSIILSWGINDSYKLILWSVVILLVVLATLDNEPSQKKIKE